MFKTIQTRLTSENNITQLNYIYSLLILIFMAFILTAALYMQLMYNELPCPLCLLQRAAYFGICFGIILNLRNGFSLRHEGLTLLAIVLLLIISTRQTLLDLYPRPGHEYVGTAILGLHMPVWSIVFSVVLLLAYAIRFSILGYSDNLRISRLESYPKTALLARIIIWYVIVLCIYNVISTFMQCGFDSCHTFGYRFHFFE